MHTAADLIFEKRNKSCELVVILFEYCNFACTFCPQDHDSTVGMTYDDIVSKADPIVEYINNNVFATEFVVRLIGGEPFNDDIIVDTDLLQAYTELAHRIRTRSNLRGRPLEFIWISNFSMVECRPQVMEFMEAQSDGAFVVSYDFKGRFNPKNREIFKENIEIYAKHIHNINTVMTRQNIESVLAGDEYYDYLYGRFDYSWDMYIKGDNLNDYAVPKESQVLEFYKLLADKYPEVEFIRPFLKEPAQGSQNHALCSRGNGFAIDAEGHVIAEGCVGTHYLTKKNIPIVTMSNRNFLDSTIEDFLEKYDCHACPFYQRCPMVCFSGVKAGNMINDMSECINKLTFEYVDAKKNND